MKFSLASVALAVAMALVLAETHGAAAGKLADDPSLPVIDAPADTNGAESAPAAAAVTEDIPAEPAAVIAAGAEDPSLPVIDHAAARAASEPATDEQTTPAGATSTSADTTSNSAGAPSGRPHGDLIARHAQAAGVPVALAKAVVRIESNFNARARGRAGEVGLMQIKPQTARGIGYSGSVEALYDPDTNLRWGMKYLAGAYQLAGGDICGTVMRYQGGHYARRMTGANRTYCSRVQSFMANGTIRTASL